MSPLTGLMKRSRPGSIGIHKRQRRLRDRRSLSILCIVGLVQSRVFRAFGGRLGIILRLGRSNIGLRN